jgi:hypothetical protein
VLAAGEAPSLGLVLMDAGEGGTAFFVPTGSEPDTTVSHSVDQESDPTLAFPFVLDFDVATSLMFSTIFANERF